jgi:hypothetical protein
MNKEINEVMWYTPSFINLFGLDPFANSNIAFSEFGASFAGHTLYHVMPVFDMEAGHWKSFRWDSVKSILITLGEVREYQNEAQ